MKNSQFYHDSAYMTHLTAALGMEPSNRTGRPRYRPRKPCCLMVWFPQSIMPLYFLGFAFSSSCNWVFVYSVGYVMHISIPPAIPPARIFFHTYLDWNVLHLKKEPPKTCWPLNIFGLGPVFHMDHMRMNGERWIFNQKICQFSMSFNQLSSISSRKVTQLTHCTSSIEAPAASDIDFDFNQTNLWD